MSKTATEIYVEHLRDEREPPRVTLKPPPRGKKWMMFEIRHRASDFRDG